MTESLAVIGAGNMAEAIVRSVLAARAFDPIDIHAADPSPERRDLFERQFALHVYDAAANAAARGSIVLLAVKPQHIEAVLNEIAPVVLPKSLVISVVAGVRAAKLDQYLSAKRCRIVRAMPNTPMLVGAGAVALAAGPRAAQAELAIARRLFEDSAVVVEVEEEKLDAVTALSGSGPAYFFYLVEAMTAAGVANGLSEVEALTLARRTAFGAGKMLEESPDTPAELRRKVTSPGGTTHAAIESMRAAGFFDLIRNALTAATQRGRELGND